VTGGTKIPRQLPGQEPAGFPRGEKISALIVCEQNQRRRKVTGAARQRRHYARYRSGRICLTISVDVAKLAGKFIPLGRLVDKDLLSRDTMAASLQEWVDQQLENP
jgi:hypothetical protein